jgi:ubiquinone/menaquinone biosynthesis C-methylase UbiE
MASMLAAMLIPAHHPLRVMPGFPGRRRSLVMPAYDLLAPHYDAVTGDSSTEAALVRDIIERRHGRVATLLDVACGTGAITLPLSRTYQVSGLDISPGMLAVAREKLPAGIPLYQADMTSFRLGTRFDAIVCAYQGVNHLLSLPAWQSFFGCAYRHLNPGGLLVFDIATVGYLTTMTSIPKVVQPFDGNYLQLTVSTTDGALFEWHVEVFELQRDGRYRLLTQALEMRSFPVSEVEEALGRRFVDIEVIGGDGGSAGRESEGRIWLACARPA